MNQPQELQNKLVGDIVADNYHAAGVFREFGIDFCCGGGVALEEICKKKGIDLPSVTDKLETVSRNIGASEHNYKDWEPDFLIDYIINTHHQFVRNKTEEISAYALKVAKVHGERHPENVDIFQKFTLLSRELMDHLEAEEQTVFPLIKELKNKYQEGKEIEKNEIQELEIQLEEMVGDHDGAGQLMEEIRELSHNFTPPSDACTTYRILYKNLSGFEEDLHKHVHLENNILFKKAENLLDNLT